MFVSRALELLVEFAWAVWGAARAARGDWLERCSTERLGAWGPASLRPIQAKEAWGGAEGDDRWPLSTPGGSSPVPSAVLGATAC